MRELENYLGMELGEVLKMLHSKRVRFCARIVPCPNPKFELDSKAMRVVRLRKIDDVIEVVAMPEQKAPSK